jgi:hypothetical protein
MSSEVSRPTMYRIDVWCRTVVLAFTLVAATQVPAQINHEPDDRGDDVREQGRTLKPTSGWEVRPTVSTVVTIPLSGTGVEVKPNRLPSSKPVTAKPLKTVGSNKGTELSTASAAAPKTKERTNSNEK